MPDAGICRDPATPRPSRFSGRAGFIAITVGLHAVAALALWQAKYRHDVKVDPVRIDAALLDTLALDEPTATIASSDASNEGDSAPLVASVEYVRTETPVYPKESQRRREHGTVLVRVLLDALGRPVQVQVERSSGFDRRAS